MRRVVVRAGLAAAAALLAVAGVVLPSGAYASTGPAAATVAAMAGTTGPAGALPPSALAVPACPICVGIGVGCAIFTGVCADAVDWVLDTAGVGEAVGGVASLVLAPLAEAVTGAASELIAGGFTWWMSLPTVDVTGTGVAALDEPMALVGAGIAVLLLLCQAARTIITRRGAPLAEALEGLVRGAVVVALAATVVGQMAAAADALTDLIARAAFCDGSANCDLRQAMADAVSEVLLPVGSESVAGVGFVILTALVVFVVMLVQLVLLFLRQVAVPILLTLTPVAAAGQIGGQTPRAWLSRLAAAVIAVILYKPLAMLIIAVGFTQWELGESTADWIRGLMTLVLAVVAMPALMKIFTPITAVGTAAGGGLATALSLASTGMWANAMLRGGSGGTARSAPEVAAENARTGPATAPVRGLGGAAADPAPGWAHPTDLHPPASRGPVGAGTPAASTPAGAAASGSAGSAAGVTVAVLTAAAVAKEAVDRAAGKATEQAEAAR